MRVLMLVMSNVDFDSRVQREARALVERGHTVTIGALGGASAEYHVVGVAANSPFPGGGATQRGRFRPLRRVARWLLLPHHENALRRSFAKGVRQSISGTLDVVHAHDLETLPIAAEFADKFSARLVYDAHEFWAGRRRSARPTPLRDMWDLRTERRLGLRADHVLTVGPQLADRLRELHAFPEVTVVRNTFPELKPPHRPAAGPPSALLYAGNIMPGRDLETLSAASSRIPLDCIAVGPVLHALQLPGIDVRDAIPVDRIDVAYRESGLAIVPLTDDCENHRLALPNRLFHALRAGVPVIAADLPQMRALVEGEGFGALYSPGDVDSLVSAVEEALARYESLAQNVRGGRAKYLWGVDRARLLDVYDGLAERAAEPRLHAR